MKTVDRAVKEFYTDGRMNEQGFMMLDDMRETLNRTDESITDINNPYADSKWDKDKAIDYVVCNHGCSKGRATDLILWALDKLTA